MCIRDSGSANRDILDTQRRLANADRYALSFLSADTDSGIQLHIVADHGNPFQDIRTVSDQCRPFYSCLLYTSSIAMVTDYDCWHPDHEQGTIEQVIKTVQENAETARKLVKAIIPHIQSDTSASGCTCRFALENAIIMAGAMPLKNLRGPMPARDFTVSEYTCLLYTSS